MARPLKEINWDYVELQVMAGCKAIEIYPELGINDDTFYKRFKDHFGEGFQDYSGKLHSVGHGKIRKTQFEKALEGNTQMLTILGREWLGQEREQKQASQTDTDRLNTLISQLESLRSSSNQASSNNSKDDKS